MLDQFLNDGAAIQRMRVSPLGAQLDSFAARQSQLGYARSSIRDRLWTLAALGRWLKRRGRALTDLRPDLTAAFLNRRMPDRRVRRSDAATLRLFLDHLEANAIIPGSPLPSPTPITDLKARYEAHLEHDRGLSPVTGPRHWCVLERFLNQRFDDGPLDLRTLTVDNVTHYVLEQSLNRSPASAQLYASTLRSFHRLLWTRGRPMSI